MDYEYWNRILQCGSLVASVDAPVAAFRFHVNQKSTARENAAAEMLSIARKYLWDRRSPVSWADRFRLQNRWLYSSIFLETIKKSLAEHQSRPARYLRVCHVLARHPRILLEGSLLQRFFSRFRVGSQG
jgi:hypothetical protein